MAGSTPTTRVSRDPRLRQRQPSRAEEPPVAAEEECELSSDDEEGGAADKKHPMSQYRGVYWRKERLIWESNMSAKMAGKNIVFLGSFDFEDEEGAARTYDRGQIAYHGRKEADQRRRTNFPVQQYSHELDWLEGLGVVDFAKRLMAARKQLRAVDKQVTAEATLEVAKAGQGEPSPGPQQHGTSDNAADEEIKIRTLVREGTPPPTPRPAAGQASRQKRSRPAPRDTPAAKRRQSQSCGGEAAAIAELRRDVREAELKAKTAGLASFNEYLQAEVRDLRHLNASLLANNKSLLSSNASLLAGNAQKDKQLQAQQEKLDAQQEKLDAQQEKLIAHLHADSPDLRRLLSRQGAQ